MADNSANAKTSVGLMGLSHFTTSRVSMENWEPVYLNLFTVEISLPDKLTTAIAGSAGVSDNDVKLLLEGVKNVKGLDTNKMPGVVTQTYKYADRSFAGSGTDNTFIDVTMDIQVNLRRSSAGMPDMYAVKILRAWNDLVWDPLTGRQGLKVDYVAPQVTITMHDKANQPFWQWTLYNVFPTTGITTPDLDYSKKNDIYLISGYKLRCDYWEETML
jgi:hypothetical protein